MMRESADREVSGSKSAGHAQRKVSSGSDELGLLMQEVEDRSSAREKGS